MTEAKSLNLIMNSIMTVAFIWITKLMEIPFWNEVPVYLLVVSMWLPMKYPFDYSGVKEWWNDKGNWWMGWRSLIK